MKGKLGYRDKTAGIKVKSVTIQTLTITGNVATFSGTCKKNGNPCTFTATVTDNGKPGTNDRFQLSVVGRPVRRPEPDQREHQGQELTLSGRWGLTARPSPTTMRLWPGAGERARG